MVFPYAIIYQAEGEKKFCFADNKQELANESIIRPQNDREVRETMIKINQISHYGIQAYQKSVNRAGTDMKTAQTDKVEISKQAMELQNSPTVASDRQAKIDEIKNQIDNGTYRVNTKATAEGLLNFYTGK